MNKISVYILTVFLSLFSFPLSIYSQGGTNKITIKGQDGDVFYHTVERGQTVYSIATMYGVSVEDIYRLNPESRTVIKTGTALKVPQQDAANVPTLDTKDDYIYHTIQPRETLYGLSVRYEVTGEDILKANPGLSVATFAIGKTIRIPAIRIETLPTTEIKTITKEIEYTVAKKETMYSLTRKFKVSSTELTRLNPQLKDGVKAGMVIKVPVTTEEKVTTLPAALDERDVNALLTENKGLNLVDRIQVDLLLPFMTNETRMSDATARFVEYYEGMLLAVDSLRNTGCSIDLNVYDTGNGTQKLKEILKNDVLKKSNLIIGAVQNEQIKPIAEFAQENNIKYVIPFTSRNDEVLSNANIFQVNTPHSYLYAIAAQAGCDMFAKDNIVILTIRDKEEKPEFISALKSEMQSRNISYKELTYSTATFAHDIKAVLSPDKRNIVVPTSASLEALTAIKSPLRMLSEFNTEDQVLYQISLFGYPEWQTYTRDCLEDLYALNAYIYSFFYADYLDPAVQRFSLLYKSWYSKTLINTFPKYGMLGFDTAMYFFSAIRKYGTNFEDSLDKIKYNSLQTGFRFERVNNWGGFVNTNLFMVQYKNDNTITRLEIK